MAPPEKAQLTQLRLRDPRGEVATRHRTLQGGQTEPVMGKPHEQQEGPGDSHAP